MALWPFGKKSETDAAPKKSGGKSLIRRVFTFDRILGLVLLLAALVMYRVDPYPLQFLRIKVFDFYQSQKPREIPPAQCTQQTFPNCKWVTIIDLDEESLSEIGQWPWPRTIVARMVSNLMQMGAALVAFDIVFAEADRMNPDSVIAALPGLDEQTRNQLKALPSNDQIFADVIKRSRVVLGQSGYWEKREQKAGPPVKKSIALKGPPPNAFLATLPDMVRNVPVIEKAATGHGLFTLLPEDDGIVRRVPSLFAYEKDLYPSLSLEMLRVLFGRPTILVDTDRNSGVKSIGIASKRQFPPNGLRLYTDSKGRVWPYFSKSDKAKYVSAKDVLAGTVDPNLIRGKMTIVGTSAVGLLDIRATPTEKLMPGVEVHAQLIEAAMTGAYLTRPFNVQGAEFLLILFVGLLMVWLVPQVGAKWTMLLFFVVAGGSAYTSWYLFAEKRILFDASYAVVSILLIYTLMTYTGYAKEEAQRRQTRDAFSKYLSPDMVERVAGDPSSLKLGGDKRDLTLLFCDVRGFTTISEQFDAVGLTALINKLLTPLTNAILERQGTVDKYMGDCIMAFWNAPLDDDDHAYHGCTSALAMLAEMGPLNDRLEAEAKEEGRKHIPLKVGLGLNSGECVVGNMGSDQRFDYSVLGDTVNLASRLEGQSKSYGMNVVLGPTTHAAVEDRLATIDLDFIQVKGKTSGTHIFALMGDADLKANSDFQKIKQMVHDAIETYRHQEFDKASEMFKEIRTLGDKEHRPWILDITLDVLCDLYEDRIAEYKVNPPPEDWDGVFIATTK